MRSPVDRFSREAALRSGSSPRLPHLKVYGSRMAADTHTRAREWTAERLAAEDVGSGATFHLRDGRGRRLRVAGRHIESRQPNFFAVGDSLAGEPFDDLVVVLFDQHWSVRYAYRPPLEA